MLQKMFQTARLYSVVCRGRPTCLCISLAFFLLLTKLFSIVEITVSHIKGNDWVVFHSSITFKSLILSSFEDVSILSKVLVGTLKDLPITYQLQHVSASILSRSCSSGGLFKISKKYKIMTSTRMQINVIPLLLSTSSMYLAMSAVKTKGNVEKPKLWTTYN